MPGHRDMYAFRRFRTNDTWGKTAQTIVYKKTTIAIRNVRHRRESGHTGRGGRGKHISIGIGSPNSFSRTHIAMHEWYEWYKADGERTVPWLWDQPFQDGWIETNSGASWTVPRAKPSTQETEYKHTHTPECLHRFVDDINHTNTQAGHR